MKTTTIFSSLTDLINKAPETRFIRWNDQSLNRLELYKQSLSLAAGLYGKGVKPGDHIAVLLPNRPEYLIIYFALARLGAILVPLNWSLPPERLSEYVNKLCVPYLISASYNSIGNKARDIIRFSPQLNVLGWVGEHEGNEATSFNDLFSDGKLPPEPQPDTPFITLFTSGTTGSPKPITHSNKTLLANAIRMVKILRLSDSDVFLFAPPIFSMFGIAGTLFATLSGGLIVLQETYTPSSALRLIETEKVTVHNGHMAMFSEELDLLKRDFYNISSLCVGLIGGNVFPSSFIRTVEDDLKMKLCITYGMTETAGAISVVSPELSAPMRYETAGSLVPHTKVTIVDPYGSPVSDGQWGEITVDSPSKHIGAMEKLLHTGDIGWIGKDNLLRIVGRKRDIVYRNGQFVSTAIIQASFYSLPNIKLAAVTAVPDTKTIAAWIVPKPGTDLSYSDLVQWCKQHLSIAEIPDHIELCNSLPLTGTGKVDFQVLLSRLKLEEGVQCQS
jgi:acyl-CoA synthetase (AMP-forming)/AMP-acid ligase II